ncbi:hypothetical protein KUTeg_014343 [Tegillarca granosa]|uniref:G-protein coupled receptors family 1 profile domain-containing protein n=1 Tax=Tegillarca granosa TaxID=220873 RepID=A0ABQ9EWA4_TEGGR|nr:hypothetical protein KUTeg_014343 [Tegillarca granosa]
MRFPLMYGEPISCKVFRIIGFTAAMTSATIMIFIAFDRYYTLCNPFHKFSAKKAKCLILIGFLIAVMFAWPSAFIMGSRNVETEIQGIVGTDCSYDESMVNTFYPTVYYFILSFAVILCIIILTVIYIKIGIGIWKWKHSDIGDPITDMSSVVNS